MMIDGKALGSVQVIGIEGTTRQIIDLVAMPTMKMMMV
jgi:hypothetical protein